MKKLFIMMLVLAISGSALATEKTFQASLRLLKPITITKVQDLSFAEATLNGSTFSITVAPESTNAAIFNAQGGKNRSIKVEVLQPNIEMSAVGVTGKIIVDTFTINAPLVFNASGEANGIKVGATANVLADTEDGDYTGTQTLVVVYN